MKIAFLAILGVGYYALGLYYSITPGTLQSVGLGMIVFGLLSTAPVVGAVLDRHGSNKKIISETASFPR